MAEPRAASALFADFVQEFIAQGQSFRFQARGGSMWPTIKDGELLHIQPIGKNSLRRGDIVLFNQGGRLKAHRIVALQTEHVVTRGDACADSDGLVPQSDILGLVTAKECSETGRIVSTVGRSAQLRFMPRQLRRHLRQALSFLVT